MIRTGRTKDFEARERAHRRQYPDLKLRREDRTDDYWEQRGLEQVLQNRHRAVRDKIRAVGKRNVESRRKALQAARDFRRRRNLGG